MIYLISQLWLWILLAFILGLVVGWMTCADRISRWWTGWTPWGTVAFLIGLLVAVFKILPDRAGYMLDTALLMFGFYILGCFLSGLFRQSKSAGTVALAGVPAAAVAPKPAAPTPVVVQAAAPAPQPVATPAPAPAVVAPVAAADAGQHSGDKPATLAAPRGGTADDLKRIRGIGRQNEGRLHALGVWHFDQVAAWTMREVEWVGGYLAFPGRIEREDWVAQAKVLATGAETEFSKRVAKGEVATSQDAGDKGKGNVADLSKVDTAKPAPKAK